MARLTSGHGLGVRRRHQKGPGTHGSILEFLALIEPLTHPKDSHSLAFDVVYHSATRKNLSSGIQKPRRKTHALGE
jgi:hypothetical protein